MLNVDANTGARSGDDRKPSPELRAYLVLLHAVLMAAAVVGLPMWFGIPGDFLTYLICLAPVVPIVLALHWAIMGGSRLGIILAYTALIIAAPFGLFLGVILLLAGLARSELFLIGPMLVGTGITMFIVAEHVHRHAMRLDGLDLVQGICNNCRYDLRGTIAAGRDVCPECGEPISAAAIEHHAQSAR